MAYVVYFACDNCGKDCGGWVNTTVSLSIAKNIARSYGWQIGKRGWICPACQMKQRRNKRK